MKNKQVSVIFLANISAMKKSLVTIICLISFTATDIFGQGVKNVVRLYNVIAQSSHNTTINGPFCLYDPGKVKIVSKTGVPQAPVVYYYYITDDLHPMNSTKAMGTAYIPGYTLPPRDKNFAVTEKADLVIIKKVLDANKIDYSGGLNAVSAIPAVAVSAVTDWENAFKKK